MAVQVNFALCGHYRHYRPHGVLDPRPFDAAEFRASWGNGEVTTHRKHERMVSFFAFCVRNELLHKNAMEALKKPKTPNIVPTDYFRPDEFQAIVKAAEKYEFGGGTDCHDRAFRLRA